MNKKEILKKIKNGTFFLKDADDRLKGDEEVVLESVKLNGLYLKFADEKLKANKKIVLTAVKQNGMAIYFANNKLKADKEIALEAVKNNIEALEYVDSKIKNSLKNIGNQKSGSSLYKLIGQEITIYNQVFDAENFKTSSKIKKNLNDFIKKAEQSSSSIPVLGILDKNSKKIKSEKSELVDEKTTKIKYEIKNLGDLFKTPPKGKIMLLYYYQYLSSEYKIEFHKEQKKILFKINNFNNLAILSEKNENIDFNNKSSDKPSENYIEVFFDHGKKKSYNLEAKDQLIKDLSR